MKKITKARTCVYNVNYHIVFCTKYRKKVLTKEIEALNTEQQSALSAFVTEQMKFVGTYKDANTKEILACKNAMNSIGVSVDF